MTRTDCTLCQHPSIQTYLHWNWPGSRRTLVFIVGIWLGNNGRGSLTSLEITVSGLELTMDSTSLNKVCKDSLSKWLVCLWRRVPSIVPTVVMCLPQPLPMWFAGVGWTSNQSAACKASPLSRCGSFLLLLHWAPFLRQPNWYHCCYSRTGPRQAIKRQSVLRKLSV